MHMKVCPCSSTNRRCAVHLGRGGTSFFPLSAPLEKPARAQQPIHKFSGTAEIAGELSPRRAGARWSRAKSTWN